MEIVLKYFGVLTPISQVNEDGSKTMNDKDQKIIHRWDYEFGKPTWTTQSSKNIGKVLEHLKLGLDDETTPKQHDSNRLECQSNLSCSVALIDQSFIVGITNLKNLPGQRKALRILVKFGLSVNRIYLVVSR
jgi:formamidopyrimidine-DNA glycosylase